MRAIEPDEIGAFHAIASRREIAENLASIPHPLSEEGAREWLAERSYQGVPELVAGIFRQDGPLVGCIGISNDPVTVYYFFASEHWGQGYATEVLNPFLDWCVEEFDLTEIKVGVLDDNVGSQRVLEKSGFRNTHATLFQPPYRDTADRLLMYWKGYGAPEPLAIRTTRLYIHPIHPGHAHRLAELCDESDNFQLLGVVELLLTPENTSDWIGGASDGSDIHRFAMTSIDGLLTGTSELAVDENTCNIRMWVGSEYWTEDYGNDAIRGFAGLIFDRMPGIEKITCCITQKNSALSDLLESIGFRVMPVESAQAITGNDRIAVDLWCLSRADFEKASSSEK